MSNSLIIDSLTYIDSFPDILNIKSAEMVQKEAQAQKEKRSAPQPFHLPSVCIISNYIFIYILCFYASQHLISEIQRVSRKADAKLPDFNSNKLLKSASRPEVQRTIADSLVQIEYFHDEFEFTSLICFM